MSPDSRQSTVGGRESQSVVSVGNQSRQSESGVVVWSLHLANAERRAPTPNLLRSQGVSNYYAQHAVALKAELSQAIPRDALRAFHRKSAMRHFIVAVRQFAILGLASWGLISFEHPVIWIPLVFVQGFTVFNFTKCFTTTSSSARGRWQRGCSGFSTPRRAGFRRHNSPGGISITTPSSGRMRTIRSAITCRRR